MCAEKRQLAVTLVKDINQARQSEKALKKKSLTNADASTLIAEIIQHLWESREFQVAFVIIDEFPDTTIKGNYFDHGKRVLLDQMDSQVFDFYTE